MLATTQHIPLHLKNQEDLETVIGDLNQQVYVQQLQEKELRFEIEHLKREIVFLENLLLINYLRK